MKGFVVGLLWLLAATASAKVYYINKGVLYHLGDSKSSLSTDAEFVGTYPVVGRQWVQAFKVDRVDAVRVRIEKVRGVDDCAYCKVIVSIDDTPLGRLFEENNKVPFTTPDALAKRVSPDLVHILKIESVGMEADDFVIGDVVVESEANVTLMEPGPVVKDPGEPMPLFVPPPPPGGCGYSAVTREWLPGFGEGGPVPVELKAGQRTFTAGAQLAEIVPGRALEFDLKIGSTGAHDKVSQPLEIALDEAFKDAWVLLFDAAGKRVEHANLRQAGRYTDDAFQIAEFNAGGWNRFKVELCDAGAGGLSARLYVNGRECGARLVAERAQIRVRAMSSNVVLKSTQRKD